MKSAQVVRKPALISLLAALTGCGGGGGGGGSGGSVDSVTTPIEPAQEFKLPIINSTATGTVYSTDLAGSDSTGGQSTGSLSIVNGEQVMEDGILATPQYVLVSFSYQGRAAVAATTTYIDSSGYTLSRSEPNGRMCVPAFLYRLPDSAKIGDSGSEPTETCSDNTTSDTSWRVEDAGNGNANFIKSKVVNDEAGGVVATAETTLTINVTGNILATRMVLSSRNFPTVTLQSQ